jgi:putative ABC transport system ATP-binding protein
MNTDDAALRAIRLSKTYDSAGHYLTVLEDVSFALAEGTSCAVVGPSGSGKTTLLGLCAGLDRPTSGSVRLAGFALEHESEDRLAEIRNEHVGFVFQTFQLIPTLTALENVMVPAELRGDRRAAKRAQELLETTGLGDRLEHYPAQLSGGEQQRVALARAFINRPHVLFADEPTGNLDTDTSHLVVDLLFELNRVTGTTLMLVTHDLELAGKAERVIRLRGGRVESDSGTGTACPAGAASPDSGDAPTRQSSRRAPDADGPEGGA